MELLGQVWDHWTPEEWLPSSYSSAPARTPVTVVFPDPFPTGLLDLTVELQIDGAWEVVADDVGKVYYRDGVQLTRGRANEAVTADYSHAALSLQNTDGRWSPRNARSPNYGKIGRNTPLRVNVNPHFQSGLAPDVADSFTRTVTDTNWGTTDTGLSWQPAGTRTDSGAYAVTGSAGQLKIPATNATTGVVLADGAGGPLWVDVDFYLTVFAPFAATGNPVNALGIVPHVDPVTLVGGTVTTVRLMTDASVQVRTTSAAGTTLATTTVTGLVHDGSNLRVRYRTAGRTVQVKVWHPVNTEPTDWAHAVDDTTSNSYEPGTLFLYAGAVAGNTNTLPLSVFYDNFSLSAVDPRFTGEVASWPPRWVTGGGDVWVPIEAAGILRRLGQGKSPDLPPMARHVLYQNTLTSSSSQANAVAYWPLDDGPLATTGRDMVGTHTMTPATVLSTTQTFGQGTLASWLSPVAAMHFEDQLVGFVDWPASYSVTSTGWAVDFMRTGIEEPGAGSTLVVRTTTTQWTVFMLPGLNQIEVFDPNAATHTGDAGALFDGALHHVRLSASQPGAGTVRFRVLVDGVIAVTFDYVFGSPTLEDIVLINFQDGGDHPDTNLAVGHFVIWDTSFHLGTELPLVATTVDAALGHIGEPAATRIQRVCAENSIPLRIHGAPSVDLTTSYACGPQRTTNTLDLLRSAEATDGGILYEDRTCVGLAYRMRTQLYDQTPQLELDYTTDGHVAPPLEPTDDDALTRNDVTVNRRFGGSKQAELTSGALSVQLPPDGVGRYDTAVDLDLETDADALAQAQWRMHLGTVDEFRYPVINVNVANMAGHLLYTDQASLARLDVGDRLTVANPPAWLPARTIDQLAQGFTEYLDQFTWNVGINCSPASQYAISTLASNDEFCFRLDTDGSTIASAALSTDTTLSVASSGGLWTTTATSPADFPFDVNVAGVRVTVTAISGASSPQTFTVTRSVDGFDKAFSVGDVVKLWTNTYLGL